MRPRHYGSAALIFALSSWAAPGETAAPAPRIHGKVAPKPAGRPTTLPPLPAATTGGDAWIDTPPDAVQTPAVKYAALDAAACVTELARRQIGFTKVADARGVLAPVRLDGGLHGVSYHSAISVSQRATSPYEIFDCRLVLALDDFATLLAKHDIVEVIHMSVYRPPSQRGWTTGRIGQRHDGALAIDAGRFIKRDGTVLDVEKDFHGRIGSKTCGSDTGPNPATPAAVELRQIVCESTDAHLFNVALTPDYNWQHRNHFHLEVTARVTWFLVH